MSYPYESIRVGDSSLINTPLEESERKALRDYANGLSGSPGYGTPDFAIAVLIKSALWNLRRAEDERDALKADRDRVADRDYKVIQRLEHELVERDRTIERLRTIIDHLEAKSETAQEQADDFRWRWTTLGRVAGKVIQRLEHELDQRPPVERHER
jgi:predicted Zn-dependent protease